VELRSCASASSSISHKRDHPGIAAREIALPGVADLPWEAISDFREHPGS
jgi:hypothetical protein